MKCEYCFEEMDDSAIRCSKCTSWIRKINEMQSKYYSRSAVAAFFAILLGWRIVAEKEVGRILQDNLVLSLLGVTIALLIVVGIYHSKLNRMKKAG